MNTVILVGEPGSGKSTLVKRLLGTFGEPGPELALRVMRSNNTLSTPARARAYPEAKVLVPGVYDGSLAEGTDRLGRCSPRAMVALLRKFAVLQSSVGYSILAEGDRITDRTTLGGLAEESPLRVYLLHLQVDPEVAAARRRARDEAKGAEYYAKIGKAGEGSWFRQDRFATGASPVWLRGRATKLTNTIAYATGIGVPVHSVHNDSPSDLDGIAYLILDLLGGDRLAHAS